jgi:hypothetical protein
MTNMLESTQRFSTRAVEWAASKNYIPMADDRFLKMRYERKTGCKLNLEEPQTFSEKLQWLKLHDRRPEYTIMVDKYAAKQYVADKIGQKYIIPTMGLWERYDAVNFDRLPDQFVLKCTHNSGGAIICRNKDEFNKKRAKELERHLKYNYFWYGREWPYKHVKPGIIAEVYMEEKPESGAEAYQIQRHDLADYKFYCFNGAPMYCQVILNRSVCETIDFFDMEWNHMEFTGLNLPGRAFPKSSVPIPAPSHLPEMKEKAAVLSYGIPFVRIDFYEVQGAMYFGEMTFYPASGFGVFEPDEWNYKMGDLLKL